MRVPTLIASMALVGLVGCDVPSAEAASRFATVVPSMDTDTDGVDTDTDGVDTDTGDSDTDAAGDTDEPTQDPGDTGDTGIAAGDTDEESSIPGPIDSDGPVDPGDPDPFAPADGWRGTCAHVGPGSAIGLLALCMLPLVRRRR